MKSKITITLLLLLCCHCYAKDNYMNDMFDEYKKSHHLQCTDSLYAYSFVAESKSEMKPSLSKTYFWFLNNAIHSSAGNYNGKLLNGAYVKMTKKERALVEKGNFTNGLKDGAWYNWNLDGTLSSYTEYKGGVKNGKFIQYAENNIPEITGSYKNDLKSKKWTIYKDGHLYSETTFKEGEKNGYTTEYDTLGNKTSQLNYKKGKLNGTCYYYQDKNVSKKERYKDGILVAPKEKKQSFIKKLFTKKPKDNKDEKVNSKKKNEKENKGTSSKRRPKKKGNEKKVE
ncbi:MAG: hypothetical protein K6F48_03045 [Paludibacteraceae bacterium]|nr:hypothetical protein [Paludibacteraceae bacterium]